MANPQLTLTRYDIGDLNNGKVAAFPVPSPPGWDDISLYYAKALKAMGWQQSPAGATDVTSMWPYSDTPNTYFFQAAMHWWPQHQGTPPAPYNERWSHCTHGPASAEQYFLAWHRAFIYFFEVIVRAYVAELGGPSTWALPYWNYSYLRARGGWDENQATITFVPAARPREGFELRTSGLHVGSISIETV